MLPSPSLGPIANLHGGKLPSSRMLQTHWSQIGLGPQAAPRFAEHGTDTAGAVGRIPIDTLSGSARWQGRLCRPKTRLQRYAAPSSPIFSSRFSPDWYCSRCDSKSCRPHRRRCLPAVAAVDRCNCMKRQRRTQPGNLYVRVCVPVRACTCALQCKRARQSAFPRVRGCARVCVCVCGPTHARTGVRMRWCGLEGL